MTDSVVGKPAQDTQAAESAYEDRILDDRNAVPLGESLGGAAASIFYGMGLSQLMPEGSANLGAVEGPVNVESVKGAVQLLFRYADDDLLVAEEWNTARHEGLGEILVSPSSFRVDLRPPTQAAPALRGAELAWMRQHAAEIGQYAGRWIAIEGTQIVAVADSEVEADRLACEKGVKIPFVVRVPLADEPPLIATCPLASIL